jgi:hypothetical protein
MLEYFFVLWSYIFVAVCTSWNVSLKEHFCHKWERSMELFIRTSHILDIFEMLQSVLVFSNRVDLLSVSIY